MYKTLLPLSLNKDYIINSDNKIIAKLYYNDKIFQNLLINSANLYNALIDLISKIDNEEELDSCTTSYAKSIIKNINKKEENTLPLLKFSKKCL